MDPVAILTIGLVAFWGGLVLLFMLRLYRAVSPLSPSPVPRHSAVSTLWLTLFAALLWAACSLVVFHAMRQPLGKSLKYGAIFVVLVTFVLSFFQALRARIAAGEVLLDLGPTPLRKTLMQDSWFSVAQPAALLVVALVERRHTEILLSAMGLLWGIELVGLKLSRLQIRRNGIYYAWSLIQWDRIESYKWNGSDVGDTLLARVRSWPVSQFMYWEIPPLCRSDVDRILKEHVPYLVLQC